MITKTHTIALIGLLAVVLAACGAASVDQESSLPTAPGIAVGEPHPDAPGDLEQGGPIMGTCLPDTPDCADMGVDPPAPTDGRCLPEDPDCLDTSGPIEEPGEPSADPVTAYRPVEPEGDVAGEGTSVPGDVLLDVDGNRIEVGFWMGVQDCYAVEDVDVSETDEAVSVDIVVAARSEDRACTDLAEARSVSVELDAPLGDRVLDVGGVRLSG